jgi:beta-glucosidase
MRILMARLVAASVVASAGHAVAQESDFDAKAQQTERQMTDDERFSMLISVMGKNINVPVRDERIPKGIPMSAGYAPGVPRPWGRWALLGGAVLAVIAAACF